jgi:predicted DNA binding protein
MKSYQESKAIYKEKKALAEDKNRLDKMFETLKEAGLPTWKEIAYFGCLADLVEVGTAIEDVQKILLEDPEAVEKIIESAKIEEEKEQEIADEDIPD